MSDPINYILAAFALYMFSVIGLRLLEAYKRNRSVDMTFQLILAIAAATYLAYRINNP